MRRYVALLHPDQDGGYGVSFPDFPGCISGGDDWEDAAAQAAQALRFHVEGMIEDGEKIPDPRGIDDLYEDPETAKWMTGAVAFLVPLLPPRGKAERLNISLDSNLVRVIDDAAEQLGMTRSAFLAEAAVQLVDAAFAAGRLLKRGFGKASDGGRPMHGKAAHDAGRDVLAEGKRLLDLETHPPKAKPR